jgi:TetR/AcrR family transcriptional regulator, regulator of autoinduction and epiphytic fitness
VDGNVNPRRPYHSPKRQAQAAQTRARMLQAAAELFAERGYVRTTVADVARQAGVSEPNVYAVFTDKPGLLAAAIQRAVRGKEPAVPLRDQPAWQRMLTSRDGTAMLRRFAALQRQANARVWPLIDAVRAAAASEPVLAAQLAAGAANRWNDCRAIAAALGQLGQLSPEISIDMATDMLWAMCSAEMYRMLVIDRHWPARQYESWVADALSAKILHR